MACKRRILCPLSVVMIIVAFLQASGTIFSGSSVVASSSDLILIVQTESPFYGFGEVVKIRGNLTDTNGTAIQGAKIAVEVRNPRNNTVFLDIVFTSIDGTFEDSFRLDKNAILGDYYVYGTANAIGYPATANQTAFMVVTVANLSEKTFIASDLNETVLLQNATINNAEVQGDLSGALSFTRFEMVNITTGPFAGKGFSKGTWEATLEGISYRGEWRGAFYFMPSDRKIYLKGAVSGEMTGVAEGYVSESFAQSGVYDRYLATWKIGRLGTAIFSATLSLNGTLVYHSYSEFPFTGLCILQTSIEGSASGHYNCSLSSMLTQIRVSANSPFIGEGFSVISYSSNYGMGEGWTYDRLASPGTVEMKGFLTSPLYGIVYATLNETTLPRSLHMYIERVDLGLPPMADLKLKIWGPERASPGQTITYAVELRNDGLKSAENVTVLYLPPLLADFLSVSVPGSYDGVVHIIRWDFQNISARTCRYLDAQVKIFWELPGGIWLAHSIGIYGKETADGILNHSSPKMTEKGKMMLSVVQTAGLIQLPPVAGVLSKALSITMFLYEEPLTPIIIGNYARYLKACDDGRIEEALYLRNINSLLSNLQSDPEYLSKQNKSFRQAVEEIATDAGYTPPKGATQIAVARDPNIKSGPDGYVSPGQTLNYTVEYENEGEGIAYGVHVTDTLAEDLNDTNLEISPVVSTSNGSVISGPGTYNPSTRTITWLIGEVGPNEGGVANFSAKVRNDAPEGTEIINSATVYFPSVPETTRTNTIVSVVGQPNIAVKDLIPLETSAKIGSILYLNATVANEGYFAETINITLYANSTTIGTQNITLTGRSENTVIFIWNTTNSLTGNYAISAYVWPVPGETNTVDNTFVDGWVVVTSHGWELDFAASTRHPIVDFAVYIGSLYAAADNKLYVKDGSSWNVVDAPTFVTSLEPYGGKLVVGGQGGLYCFDGTSFNMVFSVPTYIKVLGVYNNTLYAGTFLDKPPALYYCNGSPDNPSNWHADNGFSTILNFSGPFGSIDSFAVYDNAMFVSSGGTVYSYNGTEWSIAASYDDVYAFVDMQVYNGRLYLATRDQGWRKPMYLGGSGFSGRVIEFDGTSWTTVFDHDYWIFSLETYDNKLFVGTANKIYTYDGTNWNTSFSTGEGAYYAVSLITFNDKIYVGMGNGYIFADPVPETVTSPELPPTATVPEFQSATSLLFLMVSSLIAIVFSRRRIRRKVLLGIFRN